MDDKTSNFIHDIIDADLAKTRNEDSHPLPARAQRVSAYRLGHNLINWSTAKIRRPFNLRYDDTNPEKEDNEYVEAIYEDLIWLAPTRRRRHYGSDYFGKCYDMPLS